MSGYNCYNNFKCNNIVKHSLPVLNALDTLSQFYKGQNNFMYVGVSTDMKFQREA